MLLLMLVSIESTQRAPRQEIVDGGSGYVARELLQCSTLSAALVCCPTSPEDGTWLNTRGMSRQQGYKPTTLLLDGPRRRPMKRASYLFSGRL